MITISHCLGQITKGRRPQEPVDHQLPPSRLVGPSDGLCLLLLQTLHARELRADQLQVGALGTPCVRLRFLHMCFVDLTSKFVFWLFDSGIRRLKDDAFPTVFDSSSTTRSKRAGATQRQDGRPAR